MRNPLRLLLRNKRAVVTAISYVSAACGFVHIWRKRKEIDQILDSSYDARHSDDKDVRKEANWKTTKALLPVVTPSVVTIGLGAAGIGWAQHETMREMQNIRTTTEKLSAAIVGSNALATETQINTPISANSNLSEVNAIPPNSRGYFFAMTGEILYLPKTWHEIEMPCINKQIEIQYNNSDNGITLGDIRWLLGLKDGINIDDILYFPQNYAGRFDPPQLEIKLPTEMHGRGYQQDNMLEIHVTGFMAVDDKYSLL